MGNGPLKERKPPAKLLVAGAARHQDRRHGLGAPQSVDPSQARIQHLARQTDRVVVGRGQSGRGVGQDQGAGAFGSSGGEHQRHRACVDLGHDGDLLGANLIEHHRQLLGPCLPWWEQVQSETVGDAGTAAVEANDPREGAKSAEEQGNPRVVPDNVHVGEVSGGQHHIGRAVSEYLVADSIAFQARVVRVRLHRPSPTPAEATYDSRSSGRFACFA
jgi:hypothetical protein